MTKRTPANHLSTGADLLKAAAHPARLAILEALAEHSQCVKELNARLPISQARFSQHMASLRRAGLVDCHVNGPQRCYYLLRPRLVCQLIRLLAADHPVRYRTRESVVREVMRWRNAQAGTPCTTSIAGKRRHRR